MENNETRHNENFSAADEQLLKAFFDDYRTDVPDNGFTRRVMRRLPERSLWLSRLWTFFCAALAIGFLVWGKGWQAFVGSLRGLWADVSTHDVVFSMSPLTLYLMVIGVAVVAVVSSLRYE